MGEVGDGASDGVILYLVGDLKSFIEELSNRYLETETFKKGKRHFL